MRTFHGEFGLGVDTADLVGRLAAVLCLVGKLSVAYHQSHLVAAHHYRILRAVHDLAPVAEAADLGRRLTEVDVTAEDGLLRRSRHHVLERLQQLGTVAS